MKKTQKQNRGGGLAQAIAKNTSFNSFAFFNSLSKYIPSLVLQKWIKTNQFHEQLVKFERLKSTLDEDEREKTIQKISDIKLEIEKQNFLPYIQEFETVVLFADISGFTKVSEACAKLGMRGNEELAFCINRYMEGMVKNLSKFGGDIIKFVGDAMIVMWPRKTGSQYQSQEKQIGLDDEEEIMDEEDEKVHIIRKAIQCAIDIQREMDNKTIMKGVTGLSVKIGIAYGKCALFYVGGVFGRSENFTVGPALSCALESEGCATSGGQIIVCHTAYKPVESHYRGELVGKRAIEALDNQEFRFYKIVDTVQGVRGAADAVLIKNQIKQDMINNIQQSLRGCVPNAIMPYLEIGFEQYGSEIRTCTVMFTSLGVDLSDSNTSEGRQKIQKIITVVQQQVYKFEGSLNKLVMDDKGSTLICIWGVSPMAHVNDPERAILCAISMRKELHKIDGTTCTVGIATGDVFSGVVGTSGSRKEFSVLGDTVNLAARIMFWPKYQGKEGSINVCVRTKNEAMRSISFKYGEHAKFKGKSISLAMFTPIDPNAEFTQNYLNGSSSGNRMIQPQSLLKLNYNPLVIKRDIDFSKYEDKLIGRQPFVHQIFDQIKNFFSRQPSYLKGNHFQDNTDKKPLNMIITGEIGSGKTHCIRALVEKLQKDQELIQYQQFTNLNATQNQTMSKGDLSMLINPGESQKAKLPIFSSAPNVEQRKQFMGAWRPILRTMFEFRRRQLKMTVEDLLKNVIQEQYEKIDLIMQLFGFYPYEEHSPDYDRKIAKQFVEFKKLKQKVLQNRAQPQQIQPSVNRDRPDWFLQKETYSNQITNDVLQICLSFIQDFLGEELYDDSQYSHDLSNEGNNRQNKSNMLSKKMNQQIQQMAIFIFDNGTHIDSESYSLILRIFENCSNVCILMIVDQDHKSLPTMPKLEKLNQKNFKKDNSLENEEEQYCIFDHAIEKEFIKEAQIFDVPSLNQDDLSNILKRLGPDFNQAWIEEVQKLTQIRKKEDPKEQQVEIEQHDEWKKRLFKQYKLDTIFTSIQEKVVKHITSKCVGLPLVSLEYFLILLSNDYLNIDARNQVVATPKLESCIRFNDFTKIQVPNSVHKRRSKNMDDFLQIAKTGKNQRQAELHVKGLLILKAACVIGDDFRTGALKKILPLRNETHSSLTHILKELEIQDFIEILDESDPKDVLCRFNKSFLRESTYQVMLYKNQKQVLHRQLSEYILSLPAPLMDKNQIELELQKLENHILIGEDLEEPEELPFKQMHGLIAKKMQYKLVNNSNIALHSDIVYKQGKKATKTISKRLLVIYPRELMWYHNKQEFDEGITPLGEIQIKDIYKTSETLMQSGSFDFDISFTKQIKKGILDENPSFIKFGCQSASKRMKLISIIDFLRLNTHYEDYVNKYVLIQLPLRKDDQFAEEEDNQYVDDQILEKLSTFGKNYKSSAKISFNTLNGQLGNIRMGDSLRKLTRQGTHTNQNRRKSVLTKYSDLSDQTTNGKELEISTEEISKKLQALYSASIIGFVSQTQVQSNKSQYPQSKNKPLSRLPEWFKLENFGFNSSDKKLSLRNESSISGTGQMMDSSNVKDRNNLAVMSRADQHKSKSAQKIKQMQGIQETSENASSSRHQQLLNESDSEQLSNHRDKFLAKTQREQTPDPPKLDLKKDLDGYKNRLPRKSENYINPEVIRQQIKNSNGYKNDNLEKQPSDQAKTSGNSEQKVTQQLERLNQYEDANNIVGGFQSKKDRTFTFRQKTQDEMLTNQVNQFGRGVEIQDQSDMLDEPIGKKYLNQADQARISQGLESSSSVAALHNELSQGLNNNQKFTSQQTPSRSIPPEYEAIFDEKLNAVLQKINLLSDDLIKNNQSNKNVDKQIKKTVKKQLYQFYKDQAEKNQRNNTDEQEIQQNYQSNTSSQQARKGMLKQNFELTSVRSKQKRPSANSNLKHDAGMSGEVYSDDSEEVMEPEEIRQFNQRSIKQREQQYGSPNLTVNNALNDNRQAKFKSQKNSQKF